MSNPESAAYGHPARFNTTHWSLVRRAGGVSEGSALRALDSLCQTYWYPLYAFVRRQGYAAPDAEDLTQGFFAWLLESKHLSVADPEIGRFRSFLLCRLKHYLSDEYKKARAQKRGGGQAVISLDLVLAEEWYGLEPAGGLSPDQVFDRRWAATVMEQAVARLRAEYIAADRVALYEELKQFQPGMEAERSYAESGGTLGLSEGGVKSAIYRLRQRHREFLREEIARTVATPSGVDEEIQYLITMLSS
jgi:RNA polymerase sigma factor (sigma-70 family)